MSVMRFLLLTLQLLISTSLLALPESNNLSAYEHSEGLLSCSNVNSTLTEEGIHNNAPEVSWSSVPGAYAYTVEVTENGSTVLQNTVYGTSKTLSGLVSGHTYQCKVKGIITGGESSDYIIIMDIMP